MEDVKNYVCEKVYYLLDNYNVTNWQGKLKLTIVMAVNLYHLDW